MAETDTPVLFISYNHQDDKDGNFKNDFLKYMAPLRDNKEVILWHDCEVIPGVEFQPKIDENLEKADIVLFLISANFLNSKACMEELDKAVKMNKIILPVILSKCGWLDVDVLKKFKALPTDGKEITSFPRADEAWSDIYEGVKKSIALAKQKKALSINNLKNTQAFEEMLNDAGLLAKTHPSQEKLTLEDIFVYPVVREYGDESEKEKRYSAELIKETLIQKKS